MTKCNHVWIHLTNETMEARFGYKFRPDNTWGCKLCGAINSSGFVWDRDVVVGFGTSLAPYWRMIARFTGDD